MRSWSSAFQHAVMVGMIASLFACHKVPLRYEPGVFDLTAAHWFANEKTQYVFFSISGLREEQWPADMMKRFEIAVGDGEFKKLDPAAAVHVHTVRPCGAGRICGSYSMSLASTSAPEAIYLRYHYSENSRLFIEERIDNSWHTSGSKSDAQSVFIYGIFDKDNERVQVRLHHNFGTPNDEQVEQYGLRRRLRISQQRLQVVDPAAIKAQRSETGTNFLFPARVCEPVVKGLSGVVDPKDSNLTDELQVIDNGTWLPGRFVQREDAGGLCFQATHLNHKGEPIAEPLAAVALRNPLLHEESLSIAAPLRETVKIPLVLAYCARGGSSDDMMSTLFLDYQRFILGMGTLPVDTCFTVGEEERFRSDLRRIMQTKINEVRASNPRQFDFIFTVALNHRLNADFKLFHQIVAGELATAIGTEKVKISPRLVGAFVYDSTPYEYMAPGAVTGLVWCPQMPPKKREGKEDNTRDNFNSANCIADEGGELDLNVINFRIPLGPFPTMETYENYYRKYGDKGLSRNPRFLVRSVQTNANSVQGSEQLVTFFDGERVNVGKGQGLRACSERDSGSLLDSIAIRSRNDTDQPVLPLNQAGSLLNLGDIDRVIDFGVSWDHAFWGGVSYESPVYGKVMKFIPLRKTFNGHRAIGDRIWTLEKFDLGPLMQKCVRYCDNPYFDEGGQYQLGETWRDSSGGNCIQAKIPEVDEKRVAQ